MIGKDLGWRLFAIAASLSIHLLVAVEWSSRRLIAAPAPVNAEETRFVQLDFPRPSPDSIMPPAVTPPPAVEHPPTPKPKPKPKPKSKQKPKPKPKPEIKPKREIPATAEAEETPEPVETNAPASVPASPPPAAAGRQAMEIRDTYLARLLAKIEKNKFYPGIARRRNLQGTIRVSFRLSCDGRVDRLDVQGGHSLLRKAAGKAVEASLPLPKIPTEIDCPLQVVYAMAYSLEHD